MGEWGEGQLRTLGKPGETGREGNVETREWAKWVGGCGRRGFGRGGGAVGNCG